MAFQKGTERRRAEMLREARVKPEWADGSLKWPRSAVDEC